MITLKNEKYRSDNVLQKIYSADFLSKKIVNNDGEFRIQDQHKMIIYGLNEVQYELAIVMKYYEVYHINLNTFENYCNHSGR